MKRPRCWASPRWLESFGLSPGREQGWVGRTLFASESEQLSCLSALHANVSSLPSPAFLPLAHHLLAVLLASSSPSLHHAALTTLRDALSLHACLVHRIPRSFWRVLACLLANTADSSLVLAELLLHHAPLDVAFDAVSSALSSRLSPSLRQSSSDNNQEEALVCLVLQAARRREHPPSTLCSLDASLPVCSASSSPRAALLCLLLANEGAAGFALVAPHVLLALHGAFPALFPLLQHPQEHSEKNGREEDELPLFVRAIKQGTLPA